MNTAALNSTQPAGEYGYPAECFAGVTIALIVMACVPHLVAEFCRGVAGEDVKNSYRAAFAHHTHHFFADLVTAVDGCSGMALFSRAKTDDALVAGPSSI